MRYIYDKTGSQTASINEYPIDPTKKIKEGQVLKLKDGCVISAMINEQDKLIGIAAENHSGEKDSLNRRENGNVIAVYDSPTAVFSTPAPRFTATGGTATTLITDGIGGFNPNDFVGGKVKLVGKEQTSGNKDGEGTIYEVSASTHAGLTSTLTLKTPVNGEISEGDEFVLFPPYGLPRGIVGGSSFDKYEVYMCSPLSLKIIGYDIILDTLELTCDRHLNANKPV